MFSIWPSRAVCPPAAIVPHAVKAATAKSIGIFTSRPLSEVHLVWGASIRMSQGWTLTSRQIGARPEQMRQISSNSLRHIDRPSRSQSAIGGNECFPEIPTYPSHNKSLNPAQFVCSKMAYPVESKWDSAASSFKSCVFNVRPHSPPQRELPWPERTT